MGREIWYILQRHQKPVHKYKLYGLKRILKYKVHIKLSVLNLSNECSMHYCVLYHHPEIKEIRVYRR